MTESEFQEQQKRDLRMLADIGYAKGFNSACKLFDQALSMLGPITISVEHAKKMVDIIRRMQKKNTMKKVRKTKVFEVRTFAEYEKALKKVQKGDTIYALRNHFDYEIDKKD